MVGVGREQGGGVSEAVLKVAIYMMREVRASKIKIVHLQAKVVDTLVMDPSFFMFFHWRTASGQPIEGFSYSSHEMFRGTHQKKQKPNQTQSNTSCSFVCLR